MVKFVVTKSNALNYGRLKMSKYVPEESFIKLVLAIIINAVRLFLFPIFALILGIPFFFCWNYVMPDFGLPFLSYLKCVCFLLVFGWLCPISYHPLLIDKQSEDSK